MVAAEGRHITPYPVGRADSEGYDECRPRWSSYGRRVPAFLTSVRIQPTEGKRCYDTDGNMLPTTVDNFLAQLEADPVVYRSANRPSCVPDVAVSRSLI